MTGKLNFQYRGNVTGVSKEDFRKDRMSGGTALAFSYPWIVNSPGIYMIRNSIDPNKN